MSTPSGTSAMRTTAPAPATATACSRTAGSSSTSSIGPLSTGSPPGSPCWTSPRSKKAPCHAGCGGSRCAVRTRHEHRPVVPAGRPRGAGAGRIDPAAGAEEKRMSHPAAPGAPDDDVMGNGVFRAVLEGYDAVYDALPRGETFNRLWRMNAYHGEFPEPFAHIGFLTAE